MYNNENQWFVLTVLLLLTLLQLRLVKVSVKILLLSVLVYDMMPYLSLSRVIVFSRPNATTSTPASYPRESHSHTDSCMLTMPTPCALDWACTTTPGGSATNSRWRSGRMMVDRISRPTMFTRWRGKRETRQRCLEFSIDFDIAIVGLVR